MKILFDQGTPVPLRSHFIGHSIDTAYERGWSNLSTGDLLDAAERDGYQLLITTESAIPTKSRWQKTCNYCAAVDFMVTYPTARWRYSSCCSGDKPRRLH